uniref:Uncharacterized protein n=1 Tax=Alexandrium catenella TaxID=2925 RepID=A0A7S1RKX7_ALECA|mmetsp:Transcript_62846/g.167840  ORF Transcript_62846/g.167840 Transcript_62846/m.167840 type:complete len:195 (+) Transcript_62846:101-685(+)
MAEAEATPPHLIDIVYRASTSTTLPAGKSMSYLPGEAVPQVLASHGVEQAEWDELLRDLLATKRNDKYLDSIVCCVFCFGCWLCVQCCWCLRMTAFESNWEDRWLKKGLVITDDDKEPILHIDRYPAEAAEGSPGHATEAQVVGAPAQCSMEVEDNPVLDWQDSVVADVQGNAVADAQGNVVADVQGNAVVDPA